VWCGPPRGRERERPEPIIVGDRQEAVEPWSDGADVVDENLDRAVSASGFDQPHGPLGFGQIHRDVVGLATFHQRAQLGRRVACGGDDAGALGDERARDRQTDALACAGHDCQFVAETEVHV
jgi:hypothetical protein